MYKFFLNIPSKSGYIIFLRRKGGRDWLDTHMSGKGAILFLFYFLHCIFLFIFLFVILFSVILFLFVSISNSN
jgi:hypothetical protein